MRSALAIGALLLCTLFGPPAHAGPGDLEVGTGDTIDALLMGTRQYGAEIGVDDLRGKVVMVALWGT